VLSSAHYTQGQLVAGHPITLSPQQIVYLKVENSSAANLLASIDAYRSAGKRLSYAYQLLQVTARDHGINTHVQQLQGLFGSAQHAYQAVDYASAYSQANQIVTNLLAVPALTLGVAPSTSRLLAPAVVTFSSYYGTRSPTNLVNGSGLLVGPSGILGAADSTHGDDADGTMWYSDPYHFPADSSPMVTFDLGGILDLKTTRLWQYNEPGGFTVYGAKDIEVAVSTDNTNFTVLTTLRPARAGGTNAEPAQDFATAAAGVRYVRLHILDTFGGATASGLSEVRFVSTNTGVAITLNGVVGLHYRVEYRNSLNPADLWQCLQDIPVLSSSPLLIEDPAPFQSQRFYRAAKLP
jgi:hypothetical protein